MLIKAIILLFIISCQKEDHFFVTCVENSHKSIGGMERMEKCLDLYDGKKDRTLTKTLEIKEWRIKK